MNAGEKVQIYCRTIGDLVDDENVMPMVEMVARGEMEFGGYEVFCCLSQICPRRRAGCGEKVSAKMSCGRWDVFCCSPVAS